MNILQISIQAPGYNSGGTLGILQFSYALTRKNCVTYIGPKIDNTDVESWFKDTIYMSRKLTLIEKVKSLMHLQVDKYYILWNKLDIDFNKYDLIYIDFTRWDFVVKRIRKSGYNGKIIVRAHNVEKDYLQVEYKSEKTLPSFIRSALAASREKYMIDEADIVLAITPEDKKRLIELYGTSEGKIYVCPVGVNSAKKRRKYNINKEKKLNCLITGSLWFGPNAEGTIWILNEVFPRVADICRLTIAGANPNDEIRDACKKKNAVLVESPESMKPYFETADMVLVPIFEGGGMKVKIAEAMSYNLPVITTSHGKIGYKIVNHINGFIFDTPDGFASGIREFYLMNQEERKQFLDEEWKLYEQNYSLEAICEVLQKVIER